MSLFPPWLKSPVCRLGNSLYLVSIVSCQCRPILFFNWLYPLHNFLNYLLQQFSLSVHNFSQSYLENSDPVLFVDGALLQLLLKNVIWPDEKKPWDVANEVHHEDWQRQTWRPASFSDTVNPQYLFWRDYSVLILDLHTDE